MGSSASKGGSGGALTPQAVAAATRQMNSMNRISMIEYASKLSLREPDNDATPYCEGLTAEAKVSPRMRLYPKVS